MPLPNLADDLLSEPKVRFGCHNFLNSQPIIYPITEGLVQTPFETVFDSPARLADRLKEGELDLAFIPAVEYARIPRLKIVPGFSIAAEREVRTVILYSRKKLEEVRTVAVDQRSRASVSLLKVLMHEFYRRQVEFSIAADRKDPLRTADAALLIGDEAFGISPTVYRVYDLAREWHRFTGKPFVFSILCVVPGVDLAAAVAALRSSKEKGMELIPEISRMHSANFGIPEQVCRDYLTHRIQYDLTPHHLEGLRLFYDMAAKSGVVHAAPELVFYP